MRAALAFLLVASIALAGPCPKCEKSLDADWQYCPGCGQTLPDQEALTAKAREKVRRAQDEYLTALRELRKRYEVAENAAGMAEVDKAIAEALKSAPAGGPALEKGGLPLAGYATRAPEVRKEMLAAGGSTAAAEKAVEAGLQWLARHQRPDGAWSAAGFFDLCLGDRCTGAATDTADIGVTSLAVLAFLGAGHTHDSDASWRDEVLDRKVVAGDVVKRGVQALIQMQDAAGCIGGRHGSKYMYYHALGTAALCEAYGMTQSKVLHAPAAAAVEFLVSSQNPGKGWRYSRLCGDNDSSVTGWCSIALRSAELAGINVPKKTWAGAVAWIEEATDPAWFRTGYTARGTGKVVVVGKNEEFDHHETTTAMGMLVRRFGGQQKGDALDGGAKLLVADLPVFAKWKTDYTYWHAGTLALWHEKGADSKYWKGWNKTMIEAITSSQVQDGCAAGSWDVECDRWAFESGRVFATALNVLTLETCYRSSR